VARLATYWGRSLSGDSKSIRLPRGGGFVQIADGGVFSKSDPSVELYVLHLVRDSRAVVYSSQRKKIRPEVTDKELYLLRQSSVKASCVLGGEQLGDGALAREESALFAIAI